MKHLDGSCLAGSWSTLLMSVSFAIAGMALAGLPGVAAAQETDDHPPTTPVLPQPDPHFGGVIGRTTADSRSDFPQPIAAHNGACPWQRYRTAWFGKNHNAPAWQSSAAGPFDLWPTGLGFAYFYGFIGGDVNQ